MKRKSNKYLVNRLSKLSGHILMPWRNHLELKKMYMEIDKLKTEILRRMGEKEKSA